MNRHQLGKKGEAIALRYLQEQGYRVIETNYRSRFGEIDIIAQDKDILCFVEVRTKISQEQGHPFESITSVKKRKLTRMALYYLQDKGLEDAKARFDVVAVLPQEGEKFVIDLLRDAFDAH
ncbi:MAG: YraN family protein [Candidatus Omnitrophota bacterium]|jgi:putative endonuclease|nr:YraN family protein [Candidatus Omnitrophota bacterium]